MKYKIEMKYLGGWSDAGWMDTDQNGLEQPARFDSVVKAEEALATFFADMVFAVNQGYMDRPEDPADYRVVPVNEQL